VWPSRPRPFRRPRSDSSAGKWFSRRARRTSTTVPVQDAGALASRWTCPFSPCIRHSAGQPVSSTLSLNELFARPPESKKAGPMTGLPALLRLIVRVRCWCRHRRHPSTPRPNCPVCQGRCTCTASLYARALAAQGTDCCPRTIWRANPPDDSAFCNLNRAFLTALPLTVIDPTHEKRARSSPSCWRMAGPERAHVHRPLIFPGVAAPHSSDHQTSSKSGAFELCRCRFINSWGLIINLRPSSTTSPSTPSS